VLESTLELFPALPARDDRHRERRRARDAAAAQRNSDRLPATEFHPGMIAADPAVREPREEDAATDEREGSSLTLLAVTVRYEIVILRRFRNRHLPHRLCSQR
jgi:hypothetical protein